MRMAPLHQHGGLIEGVLKELLIGLDQKALRHVAIGIGQHAVSRDDGETFDAGGAGHCASGRSPPRVSDRHVAGLLRLCRTDLDLDVMAQRSEEAQQPLK